VIKKKTVKKVSSQKQKKSFVVVGVGMIVLLMSLVIVLQQAKINQDSRTLAAVKATPTARPIPAPSRCQKILHGKCQYTYKSCNGKYHKGYCPGPNNYQCCAK